METRKRKRVQAIYNQLTATYPELYGEEQKEKHEIILRQVEIQPSDVCLDLGCGTGDLLSKVSRKSRFVVGIDIALNMVLEAWKRLGRSARCAVVLADCEYLPFRRHSIQTLFAVTVTLDQQSVHGTIIEAKRTLSSGGLAVISVIRKAKEFHSIESEIERELNAWEVGKIQVGRDIGWLAREEQNSALL